MPNNDKEIKDDATQSMYSINDSIHKHMSDIRFNIEKSIWLSIRKPKRMPKIIFNKICSWITLKEWPLKMERIYK